MIVLDSSVGVMVRCIHTSVCMREVIAVEIPSSVNFDADKRFRVSSSNVKIYNEWMSTVRITKRDMLYAYVCMYVRCMYA